MKKFVYGIDIGGTTVKLGLFDLDGYLLEKWEIPSNKSGDISLFVKDLYHAIKAKTPNLDEVYGYGIGIPGPVVKNYAEVVVNLGWKNVNLKEELTDLLVCDNIRVANDANVAALGEAIFGAGQGKNEVAMITLGTGVGGGLIVDGKILEGRHSAAGEIGHLNVHPEHMFQCNCGNKGCLETVASATGIRNLFHVLKESYKKDSLLKNLKNPSALAIFNAAKQDDELANMVVEKAAKYIGYACSVMSIMTNPEIIVIGGGVSKAGDFLIDKVKKYFEEYHFAPVKQTEIVQAALGNDAGIFGAAKLVMNHG
jgi:glucokinase